MTTFSNYLITARRETVNVGCDVRDGLFSIKIEDQHAKETLEVQLSFDDLRAFRAMIDAHIAVYEEFHGKQPKFDGLKYWGP